MNGLLVAEKQGMCFFYAVNFNCCVVRVSLAGKKHAMKLGIKLQKTASVNLDGFVQATRTGISFIPFQTEFFINFHSYPCLVKIQDSFLLCCVFHTLLYSCKLKVCGNSQ